VSSDRGRYREPLLYPIRQQKYPLSRAISGRSDCPSTTWSSSVSPHVEHRGGPGEAAPVPARPQELVQPTRSACTITATSFSRVSRSHRRPHRGRARRRAGLRARARRQPRPLPCLRRTPDLVGGRRVGAGAPPPQRDPRRSTIAALSSGRTRLALPAGRPKF
jgi:hypothetical protein